MRHQFTPSDIERFWSLVDRGGGPDSCWPWTAAINTGGYGVFGRHGLPRDAPRRQMASHRAAYLIAVGPIPPGQCVCHRCDNPPCCNPDHLFVGTHADNVADKVAKGRQGPCGTYGTHNGLAKLNDHLVRVIRAEYERGQQTMKQIGRRFGVSDQAVFNIVHRKTWKHVV